MRVSAGPWEGSGAAGEKQGSRAASGGAELNQTEQQQQQQEQRDRQGGWGHHGIRAQGQMGGRTEAAAAGAAQLQGWVGTHWDKGLGALQEKRGSAARKSRNSVTARAGGNGQPWEGPGALHEKRGSRAEGQKQQQQEQRNCKGGWKNDGIRAQGLCGSSAAAGRRRVEARVGHGW